MAEASLVYERRVGRVFLAVLVFALTARAWANVPPTVPDGFTIERVDGGKVHFPMFAAFDDRGRLFVTESSGLDLYAEISALTRKCQVSMLEDADGDGSYEKSTVFADKLVMPMGAAWRDGKLYVPDGPDLITLEDTDGDRRADRRTVVLSGFGHFDNGGLHGVTFGPDGWLYMTCGQPDGYKLKRADGSFLEGKSGALLRCRPDGRDVQVLSRGFENLVEVVFFPTGEVIGTVNWYQKPEGGIRDALVHLAHGGLYPYVPDIGTPQLVSGPVLPAVTKFPAVALSGLVMLQGEAMGAAFQGHLLSAQHNTRKVGRHVFSREGATFRSEDFDFVTSADPDFHPSDVLEDADGSVIVVDTGSWYIHHCPTGQIRNSPATGGVYRVRRNGAAPTKDAWGLAIDWQTAKPEELTKLFNDRRPVVRERAIRALVVKGAIALPALAQVLQSAADVATIQHALWTLAQIPDAQAADLLRRALGAKHPDVVTTAARAAGARADRGSADALSDVLRFNAPPHVRSAAAEALAYTGSAAALPSIWQALAASPPPDRLLEHALVFAAHHLADVSALRAALDHPHPRVQAAALLLLDQPPRPADALTTDAVFARLGSDDDSLRQVALQRIERHPEWAARATRWIAEAAGRALTPEEDGRLLRLVLAFEKEPAVQAVAAARVTDEAVSAEARLRLVEAMAESKLAEVPAAWATSLGRLIDNPDPATRSAALKSLATLRPKQLDEQLAALAADPGRPAAERLEALRAVIARRPRLDRPTFELLLARLDPAADPLDRLAAASLVGQAELSEDQALAMLARAARDPVVSPATLLRPLEKLSGDRVEAATLAFVKAGIARGWEPTEQQSEPLLANVSESRRPEADAIRSSVRGRAELRRAKLAEYEPLLAGGDAARGRAVFFGNKVACGTCHRVGDQGGRVGPDLTKVGAVRAGRDILESVVLPSSTIAQDFNHYVAQTNNGEVHAGVIAQPGADVLELRDAAGNLTRLHKAQVKRLQLQPMSLMPDGLAAAMSAEEFRDLLAYLQSLK